MTTSKEMIERKVSKSVILYMYGQRREPALASRKVSKITGEIFIHRHREAKNV